LVENKNKIPTFWVESKIFYQNFVFALENWFFVAWIQIWDPDPGSGLWKKPWIRIRKKLIRIRNTDSRRRFGIGPATCVAGWSATGTAHG
jgi:hypothetical protein